MVFTPTKRTRHPKSSANPLSILFFWWTRKIFVRGYGRELQVEDLYACPEEDLSQGLGDNLQRSWDEELLCAKVKGRKPSLLRAIFRTFWARIAVNGILMALNNLVLTMVMPSLLGVLVSHFLEEVTERDAQDANVSATALCFCVLLQAFLGPHSHFWAQAVGLRVRASCNSLLYRKALRLDAAQLRPNSASALMSLLASDAARIPSAVQLGHYVWVGPAQVALACYFLYRLVGVEAVTAAIVLMLLTAPLQGFLSRISARLRQRVSELTDQRMRLMGEVLAAMRVIKMSAWEDWLLDLLRKARCKEMKALVPASAIRAVYLGMMAFTLTICNATYFAVAMLKPEPNIGQYQIFVTVLHLYFLNIALNLHFPRAVTNMSEILVGLRRMEEFLQQSERPEVPPLPSPNMTVAPGTVTLEDATVQWTPESSPVLADVQLHLSPGQLAVVVGPVGTGKSTLLLAVAGELALGGGRAAVGGGVAYAVQKPWVSAGTVRDNILVGRPMQRDRYRRVIAACCLERDLQLLPKGDLSQVGDKGAALSGGQRARVNLARAVYQEAEVYLLDDPLSAVDTMVAKRIFDECINGFLRGKTRILVTHQVNLALCADVVIRFDGKGATVSPGGGSAGNISKDEEVPVAQLFAARPTILFPPLPKKPLPSEKYKPLDPETYFEQEYTGKAELKISRGASSKLGPLKHLKGYYKACGSYVLLTWVFVIFVGAQLARSATDYWIGHWEYFTDLSAALAPGKWDSQLVNLALFSILVLVLIAVSYGRVYGHNWVSLRSSRQLHCAMLHSVMNAPMSFFDTHSDGAILNRFSKDMGVIDEALPSTMLWAFQLWLFLIGIKVVIIISQYFLVLSTSFFVISAGIALKYMCLVPRRLKALESKCTSGVFAHVDDTFCGLVTIRSAQRQDLFRDHFDGLQDHHTSACMSYDATNFATTFLVNILIAIYVALSMLTFFLVQEEGLGAVLGLVFYLSLAMSALLPAAMEHTVDLLGHMTSLGRVLEYQSLPQEPGLEMDPNLEVVPEQWPEKGGIKFERVSLQYSENEPPVLKSVSFEMRPGEKVGVVGRTGAGKSSLLAALFRMTPSTGAVLIDGVDTSTVQLRRLRRVFASIPQEAVLLSGSLRRNLDPSGTLPDNELWEALEEVELKPAVKSLDMEVSAGGANFSAGQRQLLCMARALLRGSKVLVLDEATANVDTQTDSLLQSLLRRKFKNCTVLTIAHRLNTIVDSDKILVMSAGEVAEFDHPHTLLQNPNGHFSKMVDETGPDNALYLRNIAATCWESSSH